MAAVTDRHFRMLIRSISPLPVLWTEMTWDRAIVEAAKASDDALERLIGFSDEEHPLVLQLGGCSPELLAEAAAIGQRRGYDAINLNCGCPAGNRGSVQSCYGVRLMLDADLVASCCAAMRTAVGDRIPITVKHRLGVDDMSSYESLCEFVRVVAHKGGVQDFIVHARHARLDLNASDNRNVPPLLHSWVSRLRADFPSLRFSINGGIGSVDEAAKLLLDGAHGVMIGRRASSEPYMFARAVARDGDIPRSRREAIEAYLAYASCAQAANWGGGHPETLARALLAPLSGMFHNTACGPRWRRALTAAVKERAELRCADSVAGIIRRCLNVCVVTGWEWLLDERPLPVSEGCTPRVQDGPMASMKGFCEAEA